jgi:CubicO group peptidase (beta-lactamase class C family)
MAFYPEPYRPGDLENPDPDSAANQLASEVATSLSMWLLDNLKDRGVPGAAWVIVTPDGVVRQETWGYRRLTESQLIEEDTIFCVRSVSKSFTALAVLIAVQEGLLDLDTPISEYIPGFTVNSRYDKNPEDIITLRHMLAHWSGFSHDPPFGIDADQPDYFQVYIERISDTWLRFPVGYRYEYSNFGYDLAGYILEQKVGVALSAFVQEKIFDPLGMTSSSFDLNVAQRSQNRAVGHKGERELPVKFPETASGGVYSSIQDMVKYARFHLNGGVIDGHRLLGKDLMEQYHSIQFARDDQATGYTLGLIREPVGSTYSLYHEGGGRGYGSHLMLYPELGLGAILLTNREYHGLTGFPGRKIMNGPIHKMYGTNIADNRTPGSRLLVQGTDPRVKNILGRYGDSPGASVELDGEQLRLRHGDGTIDSLLLFEEGGELVGRYNDIMEVRFLEPFGARPGSMMITNRNVANSNNHYLDYNDSSLDPAGPHREEWSALTGTYDVLWEDEPESTVQVEVRNGHLYFRDGRSEEHEPGLFFYYDGNVIDFRSDPPTFANQELRKKITNSNESIR